MKFDDLGLVAMYEPAFRDLRMAIVSGDKPEEEAGVQLDRLISNWFDGDTAQNRLGLVSVKGSLGFSYWGRSYQSIVTSVEEHMENPEIEAILLDINSPGGTVIGLIELSETLAKCTKPIYAYCEGICASAAYLIASCGAKVYATPSTTIGSIGVMAAYLDDKKWLENMGLKEIVFRSKNAKKKNLDPSSKEGSEQVQKSIDEIEDMFIAKIANNRSVTPDDVIAEFGQGLTFHADEALGKGMIDEIVPDFAACVAKIMPPVGGGGVEMGATTETLTLELLKEKHPDMVSQLINEGREQGRAEGRAEGLTEGAEAERNRIVSLEKFRTAECGPEVVAEAIKDGSTVEQAALKIIERQSATEKPKGNGKEVSLTELAKESEETTHNPVQPSVEKDPEEAKVDEASTKAVAAIKAAKKSGKK